MAGILADQHGHRPGVVAEVVAGAASPRVSVGPPGQTSGTGRDACHEALATVGIARKPGRRPKGARHRQGGTPMEQAAIPDPTPPKECSAWRSIQGQGDI